MGVQLSPHGGSTKLNFGLTENTASVGASNPKPRQIYKLSLPTAPATESNLECREQWRPVCPGHAYEVSDTGLVRRIGAKRTLKPWIDNGYERVGLWAENKRKNEYVHALVCTAFHGPRNGRMVDHRDGISLHNHKDNLRWVGAAENCVNTGPRTGQYKGVYWSEPRSRWIASARGPGGKTKYLGSFYVQSSAAIAYDEYAIANYPGTARLNLLCKHCRDFCFPLLSPCPSWD